MLIDFAFVHCCEVALSEICGLERPDEENTIPVRMSEETNDKKGFEIWGEYSCLKDASSVKSFRPFISIYHLKIAEDSRKNGLEPGLVAQVVLIHEIAHYVTHLGKGDDGKIWKDFTSEAKGNKEGAAQAATWLYLRKHRKSDALYVFDCLTENAPAEYQGWKEWKNWKIEDPDSSSLEKDIESFRESLIKVSRLASKKDCREFEG